MALTVHVNRPLVHYIGVKFGSNARIYYQHAFSFAGVASLTSSLVATLSLSLTIPMTMIADIVIKGVCTIKFFV